MIPPELIDDPYYDVRLAVVKQINRDRHSAGLSPVEFDAMSSLVGDRHCQEMAARRYFSHWNLKGLLAYHRYHFGGGRDHVQENLSQMTVFSSDPAPIKTQASEVLPLLLQAHARFVAEKPPLDGHRNNVLYPYHTHVGIGFAVVGPEFTMAEEFLNRFVRLDELPLELPRAAIEVSGEMLRKGFGPYYCVLFCEGEPQPRSVRELEKTYAYSDTEGDQCAVIGPWQMRFEPASGRFHFTIHPKNSSPGLYHLLLWVRDDIRSIPYQLQPGTKARVDTRQAIPAAGWIFRR